MSDRLQQHPFSPTLRARPDIAVAQSIGSVARSIRSSEIPISTSIGLVLAALAAITVIAVVIALRTRVSVAAVGWLYLLIVLPVTLRWGRAVGLTTAAVAAFLLLTFLTEPRGLPYTKNGIDLISLLLSTGCIAIAVLLVHPAEREQRGREGVLAETIRSSIDAAIDITLDGIIVSWNTGAERLYGYGPQQVIGQPITMLALPFQSGEILPALEGLGRGERLTPCETTALSCDGRRLDVSLAISARKDADGDVRGASLLVQDLTARKRVEQAFRAGDEVLVSAIEKLTDGLLILDQSGQLLFANVRARSLLRPSSEAALEGSFAGLFAHRYTLHPVVRWEDLSRSTNLRFVALGALGAPSGAPSGLYVETFRLVAEAPLHAVRYVMTLRDATNEVQAASRQNLRQKLHEKQGRAENDAVEDATSGLDLTGYVQVSAENSQVRVDGSDQTGRTARTQHGLTNRELEVLHLLVGGHSNQEIAGELCITLNTAERHIANIYRKLGIRSRVHAVAYALQHGLIPPYAP